ncbi:ABC transporter ATP-binding protein [Lachnoclostridium sp. An169]|uniref:ABC transporter ATP-binding protein n=1 Tax=Lachnoclostridium sp. An169 TaxID=1965569 RepID=UPI000B37AD90|nr:ABC transporter ATP-binding protein [Lachnoclostridium sp. An169]OUP82064.1 ABC transporter ATP-binding protein [Lachnoclostridium sp. An169]
MHRLELTGIEKEFKGKKAVECTDLQLASGIYGLLGENGAGKTTLMRMICGVLRPDRGVIRCDKIPIGEMGKSYRALLGYLPQDFGYYKDFTARRFLNYMAALKALPEKYAAERIDELLELADLKPFQNQKLKTYSGGMIRRVGIVQALLNDPKILVLDEPTAGLDPKERVRFRNMISALGKERIVLLSTHIVTDVDYIAGQILIMKEGRIIRKGTERELAEALPQIVWECRVSESSVEHFEKKYIVSNLRRSGDESGREVELRIVSEEKPTVDSIPREAVLEDIYLYLTRERQHFAENFTEKAGRKSGRRTQTGGNADEII